MVENNSSTVYMEIMPAHSIHSVGKAPRGLDV